MKKQLQVFTIAFFGIVIVSVTSLVIYKKQLTHKVVSNSGEFENIDSKTKIYTNKEFDFSIQFPNDLVGKEPQWGILGDKSWRFIIAPPQYFINHTLTADSKTVRQSTADTKTYSISLEVVTDNKYKTGELTKNDFYNSFNIDVPLEKINIQGRPAIKFIQQFKTKEPPIGSVTIITLDKTNIIQIRGSSEDLNKTSISDIEKIISSFKFLE